MGYETTFQITTEPSIDNLNELIQEIDSNAYLYNGTVILSAKWYDFTNDMEELSLSFPATLFTVKQYGEETEDICVSYFLDGDSERLEAEIVFPESTLKIK
jgi:hypothetical protein